MKMIRTLGFVLSVTLSTAAADFNGIRAFYQATYSAEDSALNGRLRELSDMEEGVKALTADEVNVLLPLAQRCWHSERATIREAGVALLVPISLRSDSTKLLEPYIDDLAPLLTVEGTRKATVYLFGATQPTASPKALVYLIRHLSDKGNSADELRMTAAAILGSRPTGVDAIHQVLDAIEQRPEFKIKGEVIQMLGLYRITNDEALRFIRSGLTGEDRSLRQASIGAIDHLPQDVRGAFAMDLLRVANDPTEAPEVRSRASSVLAGQ
jgi:hypothetical protein